MLKKADPIVTAAVERFLMYLRGHQRGDLIPWENVEEHAGFRRYTQHWTAFLSRVRKTFLREDGIWLWAVPNQGLKLQTADEQLHDRSIHRQRKATRQLTRDLRELDAIPAADLSDHQRTVQARKIDQAKTGRRAVLYSLNLGHKLSKPYSSGVPRVRPSKAG